MVFVGFSKFHRANFGSDINWNETLFAKFNTIVASFEILMQANAY